MDGTRPLGDRVASASSPARFAQSGGRAQEFSSRVVRARSEAVDAGPTTTALDVDLLALLEVRGAARADAGAAWTRLLHSLRAIERQSGGLDERLALFLRTVVQSAYESGGAGSDVRRVLASSGLFHESLLAGLVKSERGSPAVVRVAASELATRWVPVDSAAQVTVSRGTLAPDELRGAVERLLVALAGALANQPRALQPDPTPRPLAEIVRDIARALRDAPETRAREVILARTDAVHVPDLEATDEGQWLRILSGSLPLRLDSKESAVLAQRVLSGDLKHTLLATLADLADGPAREALSAALIEIESAQISRIASQRQEAPSSLPLLMRDGAGVNHVRVLIPSAADDERGEGEARGSSQRSERIAIATDFTALGPVHAELTLRGRKLQVRLRAARTETAQSIRGDLGALRERLSSTGLQADVSVEDRPAFARAADGTLVSLDVGAKTSAPRDDAHENLMDVWA